MFRRKKSMQLHFQRAHPVSNSWFYCSQCDFKTHFYPVMQTHKKVHLSFLNCEHCEYKSLYKGNLQKHMKAMHVTNISKDKLKTIECTVCYKKFISINHLDVHQ